MFYWVSLINAVHWSDVHRIIKKNCWVHLVLLNKILNSIPNPEHFKFESGLIVYITLQDLEVKSSWIWTPWDTFYWCFVVCQAFNFLICKNEIKWNLLTIKSTNTKTEKEDTMQNLKDLLARCICKEKLNKILLLARWVPSRHLSTQN